MTYANLGLERLTHPENYREMTYDGPEFDSRKSGQIEHQLQFPVKKN